ncbi:MAG: hypothetical protein H7340_13600 [Variovorax sp.]|nr:hypothetical protein [Variovorax sp.]
MSGVRRLRRDLLAPASLFMLVALSGCATNWVVDSDVRSFSMDASLSPFADPLLYGAHGGRWLGSGLDYGYRGFYGPAFPEMANSWYVREVSIVLRELASGQVVYETHASNDGPYNRSAAILSVMFEAALQGFPNPPAGERRVDIALPGTNAPARP